MTKVKNLYLMMSKASNFENSNMFLIKLLPKDFLALGTDYGIDSMLFLVL